MSSSTNPAGGGPPPFNTPGVASRVMGCSTNPDDYTHVTIHTAKCTVCDKRNMALMRRCPGCTWQICTVCFEKKDGAPLNHGNMNSASATLITPTRRVLARRADATPASAAPVSTGAGVLANAAGGIAAGMQVGGAPLPGTLHAGTGTPGTTAQATPATKKRTRKNQKGKGKQREDSDVDMDSVPDFEEDPDDDFEPGAGSPTLTSKRRRTITEAGQRGGSGEHKKSTMSSPYFATTNQAMTSSVQFPGFMAVRNEKKRGGATGGASTIEREGGDDTLQGLLEKAGVDTPENRYKEHLLGRQQPVLQNPVIYVPESIRRSFKPRPSAVEAWEKRQEKNKEGQDESQPTGEPRQKPTVDEETPVWKNPRGLIDLQVAKYVLECGLDKDQERAMQGTLVATVLGLVATFNNELPPGIRKHLTLDLDTEQDCFNETQRRVLEIAVQTTSGTLFVQLKPGSAPPTGSGPSIGLFSATPSKSPFQSGMGASSLSSPSPATPSAYSTGFRRTRTVQDPVDKDTSMNEGGSYPPLPGPDVDDEDSGNN